MTRYLRVLAGASVAGFAVSLIAHVTSIHGGTLPPSTKFLHYGAGAAVVLPVLIMRRETVLLLNHARRWVIGGVVLLFFYSFLVSRFAGFAEDDSVTPVMALDPRKAPAVTSLWMLFYFVGGAMSSTGASRLASGRPSDQQGEQPAT